MLRGVFMFKRIVLLGDTKREKGSLFNILTGTVNDNFDEVRVGHFSFMDEYYRIFAMPKYLPEYIRIINPECVIICDGINDYNLEELMEISRVIIYSNSILFDSVSFVEPSRYSCRGVNRLLLCIAKSKKETLINIPLIIGIILFLTVIVLCLFSLKG